MWPNIHAAYDRWIDPEVLLHGTPATVLDRGAPLDDEGDRGGSTFGRLLEGVSHERARCVRGIPGLKEPPDAEYIWTGGSEVEISPDLDTCNKIRTDEGSTNPVLLGQVIRNISSAIVPA